MRATQSLWTTADGWKGEGADRAHLVLSFGSTGAMTNHELWDALVSRHPGALVIGCSTGGEIHDTDVLDESLSVTAMTFDSTALKAAEAMVDDAGGSYAAGLRIGETLTAPGLRSIFILSDGTKVNGSELIRGVRATAGEKVIVTGGLAGDGARFGTTYVGLNSRPSPGRIAAIGFYGDSIHIGHGSAGGWDVFGPERTITRSEGNVLFELDGKPALDLYKNYLGDAAKDLPGSALLFPLRVWPQGKDSESLTRTIVNVDNERRAMIFAGDVPQGYRARLMRGNFDRLVEGAADAAQQALLANDSNASGVGILVSCIGRKLLLGQRIGEEVEAVRDVFGERMTLAGFYSYGEVSPHVATHCAELHNQTMTVTVFSETGRA